MKKGIGFYIYPHSSLEISMMQKSTVSFPFIFHLTQTFIVILSESLTIRVHFSQLRSSHKQFEFSCSLCTYLYLLYLLHGQYVLNLFYVLYHIILRKFIGWSCDHIILLSN